MTARVLGLDVGDRRIGLAVSDELGLTAQELPTHLSTATKARTWQPCKRRS